VVKQAQDLGAGEIVVNSVDADGTQAGFEINLTKMISENVGIPVVASGGAGTCQHLIDVFVQGKADAAIIASMIHTGKFTIKEIKDELIKADLPIRKKW
jgi:cyclase